MLTDHVHVIAIDGPSGSGKSTCAKELAKRLGLLYIDTGAMFRALAYYCDREGVEFVEGDQLHSFLGQLEMRYGVSPDVLIEINGENLTTKIREHHVSKLASIISQLPSVRQFLLDFQRQLAKEVTCVMEGRDIGTVVFPDAFCKFFITASAKVRAKRRLEQLREAGDDEVTLEQVIKDVEKRDESDTKRQFAPLKKADDAYYLDTSDLDLEIILDKLCALVRERANELNMAL